MNFIALDLEATGLNTLTDTIIEIAAVRFDIEIQDNIFVMTNVVEHSQLIYPERELDQEISMITGISNDMLDGKPVWNDIKEKVRTFIGDSIIVGHNVLFDTAMLEQHGIDLSKHTILDTFELSEIFSQDVESLNLGFLANQYNLINPEEAEHRALTDTKISIRLFLYYLSRIRALDRNQALLWNHLKQLDTNNIFKTLSTVAHINHSSSDNIIGFFNNLIAENIPTSNGESRSNSTLSTRKIIDTHGSIDNELSLIKNTIHEYKQIELITPGYKTAKWISDCMHQEGIENIISIPTEKWCSVQYITELLQSDTIGNRKQFILIAKISFWLLKTKTGLLDELKYYGNEKSLLPLFACRENEANIWRKAYQEKLSNVALLISEIGNESVRTGRTRLIKDIPLIEDSVRRKNSIEIDFNILRSSLQLLQKNQFGQEYIIHMCDMIDIIQSIYESVPERPTGPLEFPPGNHGETYFITQAMLWHEGYKWLIHSTSTLLLRWSEWKKHMPQDNTSRENLFAQDYIQKSVNKLGEFHNIKNTNINVILMIQNEGSKLIFIPRKINAYITHLLDTSIAYGSNISHTLTKKFLIQEYNYQDGEFESENLVSNFDIKIFEYHPNNILPGTVILTTSQKHARDLGQSLRKIHGKNREILIQGLSGGKNKMLSIFSKNIHKTILVGIIDTWRDEYALWKDAESIIITKVPFDPPTDPYFLARTVGMQNNFVEYSEPILAIRLTTLFERIYSSGYNKRIIITDTRMNESEWGKKIQKELL